MSRTPLHVRLSDQLRGRIRDRELAPGDLLPTESALQEEFSVSRSVVRQALATLESEGLVRRARGRGTVVSPRTELHRDVDLSSGLMEQVRSAGSSTSTEVLRLEVVRAPAHVEGLGHEVHVLERLRSVDGRPVAFIRTWLPSELAEALDATALEDGSLHGLVRERTDRVVAEGRRTIRAVAAAPPLDALLDVAERDPLLLLEGHSVDQAGRTIEVFSTWHRSDVVAFDVGLQRSGGSDLRSADQYGADEYGTIDWQDRLDQATEHAERALAELQALRSLR